MQRPRGVPAEPWEGTAKCVQPLLSYSGPDPDPSLTLTLIRARTPPQPEPLFPQALLSYAFVRSNPWHDPAAEAAAPPPAGAEVVPLPAALHRLLQDALLPRAKRDESLALRRAYASDERLQQLLAERHKPLAQLYADAGGVLVAASGAGGASVSLAGFLGVCTKRGLLGEKTLRNTAVGVTPPPDGRKKHFKVSLSKAQLLASFLDSQAVTLPKATSAASAPPPPSALAFPEFCEALVRVAEVAWREVALMTRPRRVAALLGVLTKQATEEQALEELLVEVTPPRYTPDPDADMLPEETEAEFRTWCRVWARVELRDLPGFAAWERRAYAALHARFLPLCACFVHYAGAGSEQIEAHAAIAVRPRELGKPSPLLRSEKAAASAALKLAGWLSLVADALTHHEEADAALRQVFAQVVSRSSGAEDAPPPPH